MLGASERDTQGYITRSSSLSASLITDSQCSGVPWSAPTSQLPHTPRRHDELMVTSNSLMMVGCGVNDAPVLAVSDVGMAMDAKGSTAASESADIVIMVDNLGVVPRALEIGQTTIGIALQSIWLGTIISVGLMALSVLGFLPAILGALLQEVVDLVAILGALRALGEKRTRGVRASELVSAEN
jgi:hypothetical protein